MLRPSLIASLGLAALLPVADAAAYDAAVRQNCKADYLAHCSQHSLGSDSLRSCMRNVGANLQPACISALVKSGEVGKARAVQPVKADMTAMPVKKAEPVTKAKKDAVAAKPAAQFKKGSAMQQAAKLKQARPTKKAAKLQKGGAGQKATAQKVSGTGSKKVVKLQQGVVQNGPGQKAAGQKATGAKATATKAAVVQRGLIQPKAKTLANGASKAPNNAQAMKNAAPKQVKKKGAVAAQTAKATKPSKSTKLTAKTTKTKTH